MKNFFLAGMFLFTVASASGQVFQVDSSGNVTSSASFISNGSSPGQLTLIQGSPLVMPSLTSFSLVAPASITTSYQSIVPSAGADGWWRGTFGSGAGGTVTASSGVLQTSGIVISPGGTGYTLPPACWVSASTGSGGTCAATTVAGGQVTAATIVTGGTGYPNTGTVLHFGSQVQMTFAELTGDATTSSASSPVSTVKVVGIQGVGVGGVEGTSGNSVQLTSATSTTNNHVVTYDGSGNVKDSGTLITILAQTGAGSDINSSNKVVGIQGHAVGGIEGTATNTSSSLRRHRPPTMTLSPTTAAAMSGTLVLNCPRLSTFSSRSSRPLTQLTAAQPRQTSQVLTPFPQVISSRISYCE